MAVNYREATAQEVRDWARQEGYEVGDRGRFSTDVVSAFNAAHRKNRLRYGNGNDQPSGGQATSNSRTASRNSNPAPARSTSRTSDSSPARRAPTANNAPARRQANSDGDTATVTAINGGSSQDVESMVADAINALSAAGNVGGKKGQPVLVTVTAQSLRYAG